MRIDLSPLVAQGSEGVAVQWALPELAERLVREATLLRIEGKTEILIVTVGVMLNILKNAADSAGGVPVHSVLAAALQRGIFGDVVDAGQRHQGSRGHQKAPLRY